MKRLVAFFAALVLGWFVAAPTPIAAQQPTDPEGVFRAMVDAFNSGEIDVFASYLSEDATATGFCRPTGVCSSKAEILAATSAEIAEGVHADIRSLSVSGDVVTAQLTEAAPGFAGLGIERVYIDVAFTIIEGKVTRFDDQFDLSDAQTAKFAQALEGAATEQPIEVPATGHGAATATDSSHVLLLAALLAGGVALVLLGGAYRRRRLPS